MNPPHVLLIDIDGLRPDVFQTALKANRIPNIARLVGGSDLKRGSQIPIVAPAPSVTFCSQACLFTGAHPRRHGIPGNQFFDRFGTYNNGVPRHFAFDVGDMLAVDDAIRVFIDGLASDRLLEPTIYEKLAARGKTSLVAGNMYARGAKTWIKPSLANIARFTRGGNLFGMESADYDRHVLRDTIRHIQKSGLPDMVTFYFLGLDHESHKFGPDHAQAAYLEEHVDPMVGELWDVVSVENLHQMLPFVVVFSDHGQIEVVPDDRHSLRIGFPFDREMGHFFIALDLDVHDFPGEDPNCDAVMALNNGLAFVYLRKRDGRWADLPVFQRDVLPVARAFWQAHQYGRYAPELQGALSGVLLRDVERDGWEARYKALTMEGDVISLEAWFANQPEGLYVDPVHRLDNLAGLYGGDLILISNYAEGFYFGSPFTGVHGGLHPEDSHATLVYGWPGISPEDWEMARNSIVKAIEDRCLKEGGRQPSTCDMMAGLGAILDL